MEFRLGGQVGSSRDWQEEMRGWASISYWGGLRVASLTGEDSAIVSSDGQGEVFSRWRLTLGP
jgi:hypothetical protein